MPTLARTGYLRRLYSPAIADYLMADRDSAGFAYFRLYSAPPVTSHAAADYARDYNFRYRREYLEPPALPRL
jgi:hypothetical protein